MSRHDTRGNPVSTTSTAALEATERALWRMMSFYGTPVGDLDAAIAVDPAWPLPHLMKAGFLLGLTEPALHGEARAALADANRLAPGGNARERGHLAALQRLAEGDWAGAGTAWDALLVEHPRDALALQWGHLFDFYRGDAEALQGRVGRVLAAWPRDDVLQPYVLGLHAFGLEESGRYAEAEDAGRCALAGPARVPWAIHAVAHVMEMQGRHDEGQRWMSEWRPQWGGVGDDTNGFAGHLGWHEALFALESLDVAGALAVYDAYLSAEAQEITLQRLDEASLLWRIGLLGAPVGGRWQALLARWPLEAGSDAGVSAFNDMHAVLACVGAGELARAEVWAAASIARAEVTGGVWNRGVMRELGAPLLRGLVAFGQGRFDAATEALAPLAAHSAHLGGSHAQRDVLQQTLLAAGVRGSERTTARALLAQRAHAKPATPLTAWWTKRLAP